MKITLNKDEIEEAIKDYVKKKTKCEFSEKGIVWDWFSENTQNENNIYEYNLENVWLEIDLDGDDEDV